MPSMTQTTAQMTPTATPSTLPPPVQHTQATPLPTTSPRSLHVQTATHTQGATPSMMLFKQSGTPVEDIMLSMPQPMQATTQSVSPPLTQASQNSLTPTSSTPLLWTQTSQVSLASKMATPQASLATTSSTLLSSSQTSRVTMSSMSLPLTQPSQSTQPSLSELASVEAQTTDAGAPTERMEWNDALVESLLYLRMQKYGLCFKGSKGKAQLAAAWYRIQTDFNSENHQRSNIDQLKNKFQALKTTFDNIKASEPQTGNSTENPITYPSNWPTLIQYFCDLSGMGNRDFGQTGSTSDSTQPEVVVTQGAANKRAARKRKLDLADAVASMAESLSKRLGQSGSTNDDDGLSNKVARVEEKITSLLSNQEQTLQMLKNSIESSRQVNAAILAFLQATTSPSNAEHAPQTNTL